MFVELHPENNDSSVPRGQDTDAGLSQSKRPSYVLRVFLISPLITHRCAEESSLQRQFEILCFQLHIHEFKAQKGGTDQQCWVTTQQTQLLQ